MFKGLSVLLASDIGAMVVLLATFNFIGLVRFGDIFADWGQMLSAARNWVIGSRGQPLLYWYTFLPASFAILLFSLGWNLIGDGLRVALDPRARAAQG